MPRQNYLSRIFIFFFSFHNLAKHCRLQILITKHSVCMQVCMYVCMYARIHVCMHAYMHAWLGVCMHAYMYVFSASLHNVALMTPTFRHTKNTSITLWDSYILRQSPFKTPNYLIDLAWKYQLTMTFDTTSPVDLAWRHCVIFKI